MLRATLGTIHEASIWRTVANFDLKNRTPGKLLLNNTGYDTDFTVPQRPKGFWALSACVIEHLWLSKSLLVLLLGTLLLSACAGVPTRNLQSVAAKDGHRESVIETSMFSHRVFHNEKPMQDGLLNVYLEGDGLPWIFRYFVVSDPTPRWPLMLNLMARDTNAAIYIGRPCYNGFARSPGCSPVLWTEARYSRTVVVSMVEALRSELERSGAKRVNLFGHSGGGALALLMAEQLAETDTIVTIAGNLDTDGWTDLHGYSPLYRSLNPVKRPPLNPGITQIHLMGGRDSNIPPQLASRWIDEQPNSYGVIFRDYDHNCCWESQWKTIVRQVNRGDLPIQFSAKHFKLPARRFLMVDLEQI